MSPTRLLACLALVVIRSHSADAAWLRCTETAKDGQGAFAMVTSVVDVTADDQSQLTKFQHLLAAYAAKAYAGSEQGDVECFLSVDHDQSVARYNKAWSAAIRRYGWNRTVLVPPSAWLADADVKDDPGDF